MVKRCGRQISEYDGRMECREYFGSNAEGSIIGIAEVVAAGLADIFWMEWRSRCLVEESSRSLLEEVMYSGGVAA